MKCFAWGTKCHEWKHKVEGCTWSLYKLVHRKFCQVFAEGYQFHYSGITFFVHRSSGSHNFSDSLYMYVYYMYTCWSPCLHVHVGGWIVPCGSPPGNGSGQHPSTPSHLDTHHHSHYKGGLWALWQHNPLIHVHVHDIVHVFTGVYTNMLCISRMN